VSTLPEHLSSPPVFSGVGVTRSLVLCMFCRSVFGYCVGLSVFRFTDSDYPYLIFKLFLNDKGDLAEGWTLSTPLVTPIVLI
jgi:hypothetical protein